MGYYALAIKCNYNFNIWGFLTFFDIMQIFVTYMSWHNVQKKTLFHLMALCLTIGRFHKKKNRICDWCLQLNFCRKQHFVIKCLLVTSNKFHMTNNLKQHDLAITSSTYKWNKIQCIYSHMMGGWYKYYIWGNIFFIRLQLIKLYHMAKYNCFERKIGKSTLFDSNC
jgi:hypothetical protein